MGRKQRPTALGVDIFAGGFTLGVQEHFEVKGHLAHSAYGNSTVELNLPHLPIRTGTENWPGLVQEGEVDFLYSNPPCAIWSTAGRNYGGSWRNDPRLKWISDIFGLLPTLRPRVWCWESVCQAYNRGMPFILDLVTSAAEHGYSATFLLIDAQYLGVAQRRARFFMVFHDVRIPWLEPAFKPTTFREAMAQVQVDAKDQEPPNTRYVRWLKDTPPGGKLRDAMMAAVVAGKFDLTTRGRPSVMDTRATWDEPAPTLIGEKLWHPDEDRRLTMQETKALAGFPQDYQIAGKGPSNQKDLIARGVSPKVAGWLARHVATALKKPVPIKTPERWVVDFRKDPGVIHKLRPNQSPLDPQAQAAMHNAHEERRHR